MYDIKNKKRKATYLWRCFLLPAAGVGSGVVQPPVHLQAGSCRRPGEVNLILKLFVPKLGLAIIGSFGAGSNHTKTFSSIKSAACIHMFWPTVLQIQCISVVYWSWSWFSQCNIKDMFTSSFPSLAFKLFRNITEDGLWYCELSLATLSAYSMQPWALNYCGNDISMHHIYCLSCANVSCIQ